MNLQRLKKLAGINEAKEEKLHGLYVGKKGSGKLGIQFSGSKAECHQEWKDTKHEWDKDHVHKVAPVEGNKEHIDENFEVKDESLNEVAPPELEHFVKKNKEDFKKRYGKRWKEVLYATAWKLHDKGVHDKDVKESFEVSDSINEAFDRLESLSGLLNESEEVKVEKVKFKEEPINLLNLKAVEVNDDYEEAKKELTGADKREEEKVKVPASVKRSITKRIEELNDTMDKYGGGGPVETARDKLEEFKKLLDSGNLEDYQRAQILYGTLWTDIAERLPTLLVNFLHTGKELEKEKVQ